MTEHIQQFISKQLVQPAQSHTQKMNRKKPTNTHYQNGKNLRKSNTQMPVVLLSSTATPKTPSYARDLKYSSNKSDWRPWDRLSHPYAIVANQRHSDTYYKVGKMLKMCQNVNLRYKTTACPLDF
jgi:hypothetical protein